jgi:hypothetical protein
VPAKGWCTSFGVASRVSLVAIIFGTLLIGSLIFAPLSAFSSNVTPVYGSYTFAISEVGDFMALALCLVLMENFVEAIIANATASSKQVSCDESDASTCGVD